VTNEQDERWKSELITLRSEVVALRIENADLREVAAHWKAQVDELQAWREAAVAQMETLDRDAKGKDGANAEAVALIGYLRLQIRELTHANDVLAAQNKTQHDMITLRDEMLAARLPAQSDESDESKWDELRRLYDAVDEIIIGLNPQEFNEAINWGDLGPAEVVRSFDQDQRMWLRVVIEEAAPGCEKLIAAVSAGLAAQGWTGVQIDTQW